MNPSYAQKVTITTTQNEVIFGHYLDISNVLTPCKLNLMNTGNETDLSNYVANGEWDLVEARVERNVVFYSCCQVHESQNIYVNSSN